MTGFPLYMFKTANQRASFSLGFVYVDGIMVEINAMQEKLSSVKEILHGVSKLSIFTTQS